MKIDTFIYSYTIDLGFKTSAAMRAELTRNVVDDALDMVKRWGKKGEVTSVSSMCYQSENGEGHNLTTEVTVELRSRLPLPTFSAERGGIDYGEERE